jgi:hypothetical protein
MTRPKLFDLHVHSLRSDGLYSPLQLVGLARRTALAGIALADHDHFLTASELDDLTRAAGVRVLPGVELSCLTEGRSRHLLGFGFDPAEPGIVALTLRLRDARRIRMRSLLEALERRRVALPEKARRRLEELPCPGRLHLARALVAERLAPGLRAVFTGPLANLDEVAPFERPDLSEGIAAIRRAGGVSILAHPPARTERADLARLRDLGLDGLETRFPSAGPTRQRELKEWAQDLGMLESAGSDYHGDEPSRYLGRETLTVGQSPLLERLGV